MTFKDISTGLQHIGMPTNDIEGTIRFYEALGFEVLPSQANFVFARKPGTDGGWLYRELKARGVLVRHFDAPRIRDYLRITIGTDAEMDTLMLKLEEIIR